MKSIMHNIVYSDIKIIELKLNRITLVKERLLKNRPSRFNKNKYNEWYFKLKELEKEENEVLRELQETYLELEKYLK